VRITSTPERDGISVLVSYVNLLSFLKNGGWPGRWVLDSGAYSALTSGKRIDLSRYIDDCLSFLAGPNPPEVVFALDVIGDPEATARNTEEMWRQGVGAVPTYHRGSPRHYLEGLAGRHDKIALGGTASRGANGHGGKVTLKQKLSYFEACFASVWPKWVHGFGATDPALLARIPFASCDSTTWFYGPSRYGFSLLTGTQTVPKRSAVGGECFDLFVRREIEEWRKVERRTSGFFEEIMARAGLPAFKLRFAVNSPKDLKILKRSTQ
jgi:hypothetical protein